MSYNQSYNYTSDTSNGQYGNVSCTVGGSGFCPQLTYDALTNRIIHIGSASVNYNADGDLTGDGTNTYQYDAEGRLVSADSGSTASETYNALGWRMQAIFPSSSLRIDYLHDAGGQSIGGYWGTTGQPERAGNQFLWEGGRLLFDYEADGFHAMHADTLNSTTQSTSWTGGGVQERIFYPWGKTLANVGSVHTIFAGLPDGGPLDIYQTVTRGYSVGKWRWLTPDALGGDLTNPQSLNRYAYALNNPTTFTDPLGLWTPADCNNNPYDVECGPNPCYFGDWNDCPPRCDPYFGCGYGGGGGGGRGGRGGGGGGGARPPGAPPAGQPPLAGMGNAMFGGLITCTYAQVTIGGVLYPHGPTACILAALGTSGAVAGLLHSSWVTVSVTGAFPLGTPVVGLGPTVQGSLNVSTGQFCGGGGLALSFPAFPGRAFTLGTLIHGNLSNASNILNHLSFSGSAQPSPFIGYQAIWNPSGVLGGPTVGVPGAQLAATYSGCGNIYSFLQNTF